MHWLMMCPELFAKVEWYETVGFKWLAVLATIGVCYGLGIMLANALRMKEYGWKIGVILASLGVVPVVIWARWPPNLGVDLHGGMILIYQVDERATITTDTPDDGTDPTTTLTGRRGRRGRNGNAAGVNMGTLVSQITRRINPGGTLEIKVRQYGERQIEIIIPETDPDEVLRIKRLIEKAGVLEFLIVADNVRDNDLIELSATESERDQTFVVKNRGKQGEQTVGRWVKVGRELNETSGVHPLKVQVAHRTIRDARTKIRISVPSNVISQQDKNGVLFAKWLEDKGHDEVEVLMVHDEKLRITGNELSSVTSAFDEYAKPCVNFTMTAVGGGLMAKLTSANTPDPSTRHERHLGIVLDEELLSAPTIQSVISDQGRITGQFTNKEVQELVGILRGGSLSAVLIKEPVNENPIGPELGADTIRKGALSSGIALVGVLLFMMIYYRFSGVVAVWTLLINLWIMMAVMVLFHATFTLAGIAGIVLTMGMALDANVLIFERIREELARGAALRMALRNGFSRAMGTIIDSNLTTLITAVALYVIGTDQIRGFAVTLILGILLSMYAAIFCARVVFDIGERKKWITKLTMYKLFDVTNINFMGMWKPATIASLAIIVAGLAGTYFRGQEILSIDFTGGTAVHIKLKEPMPVDQVRAKLNNAFNKEGEKVGKTLEFNLVNVPMQGEVPETVFKVDSTLTDVDQLKKVIAEEFTNPETSLSLLVQNSLTFDPQSLKTELISTPVAPEKTPAGTNDTEFVPSSETKKPEKTEPKNTEPEKTDPDKKEPEKKDPEKTEPEKTDGAALRLETDDSRLFVAQVEQEKPGVENQPENKPREEDKPADSKKEEPADPEAAKPDPAESEEPKTQGDATRPEQGSESRYATEVVLSFEQPVGRDLLRDEIKLAAEKLGIHLIDSNIILRTADPETEGTAEVTGVTKRKSWKARIAVAEPEARRILDSLKLDVAQKIYWPSWNKIGGSIAGKMQRVAFFALLVSCLGMIAYIWFRFEKLMYGLAAVVAVVHDVFITLAAIALSHWLSGVLGFAGIEDFKIGMIEMAAFLTIIGYSINDKIVVFDRIREVRGKNPHINRDMINLSLNQTLARTLLTGLSVMIVLVILYFFGGQGLHGFAFALWIGVVAGTYSSIFIATPLLLWMARFDKTAQAKSRAAA
jgi:SecD/SecF fusion protein